MWQRNHHDPWDWAHWAPSSSEADEPQYIQPDEQQRLGQRDETPVHILLTHDAPRDRIYPGSGSAEIADALLRDRPPYHFFGHYGGPSRAYLEVNSRTQSYKLADLTGKQQHGEQAVEKGAMGVLRWQHVGNHAFEILT